MIHNHRSIIVTCLLAAALLSSCQNTKKSEDESVKATTSTTTASAKTQVVMTPVEVEAGESAEPKATEAKSDQGKKTDAGPRPSSTPTSQYAADRIRDMEKGLRRLQSLPSATHKDSRRTRGKFDL